MHLVRRTARAATLRGRVNRSPRLGADEKVRQHAGA
jgi:hypothetical protein